MKSQSSVEVFARLAADYCAFIENWEARSPEAILHEAHWRLPELYSAALRLPDVARVHLEGEAAEDDEEDLQEPVLPQSSETDALSAEEWMNRWRALGKHLGDRKFYREMFDPYDPSETEPVVGDLADDLLDVYRDLRRGSRLWDRGHHDQAAWEWQFHFAVHWGEHATSAIRALYALAFNRDLGPPPISSDA